MDVRGSKLFQQELHSYTSAAANIQDAETID
jgi:hypothetical protein